jgi:hypothetical protein
MHSADFLPSSSGDTFMSLGQRAKGMRLGRRTRRRIAREVRNPGCENLLESLCKWAVGMPWVIETQVMANESMRLFVVDCPVLSRHAPWFAVETIPKGEFAFLVLPQELVRRGVEKDGPWGTR